MGVSEKLKRGVTEIVLLALLSQQDMYGYEMAQAMRERSHEKFTLLETSMYPTLYRLQDNGYISAREELVGKRRKRTYYHLEPAGRAYFQKIFAEYMTVQQGVQEILTSCQEEVTDIVQCEGTGRAEALPPLLPGAAPCTGLCAGAAGTNAGADNGIH